MDLTPQVERLSKLVLERGLLSTFSLSHEVAHRSLQAGQVWRARWDDALSLVMVDSILDGFENKVRVAPVTLGDQDADDSAVILPPSASSLELALTIWTELATEVSEIVLERWVVDLTASFSTLAAIESGVEFGGARRGSPTLNPEGPRAQEREFLKLMMEVLASATALVSGSGSLPEMFTQAGVGVSVLTAKLNAEKAWVLKVLRKEAWINLDQARVLAPLVNRSVVDVLEGNPSVPEGLLAVISTRQCGLRIRMRSTSTGVAESEVLSGAVRGIWALAARGEKGEPNWEERVENYFQLAGGHAD